MDIPIVPVLEHYGADVPTLQVGGRWKPIQCISPDHDDSRASAGTNGVGYSCLACGLVGNAITLIMVMEGVAYDRAVEIAEGILGTSIQDVRRRATKQRKRRRVPGKPGTDSRPHEEVRDRGRRRPASGA